MASSDFDSLRQAVEGLEVKLKRQLLFYTTLTVFVTGFISSGFLVFFFGATWPMALLGSWAIWLMLEIANVILLVMLFDYAEKRL